MTDSRSNASFSTESHNISSTTDKSTDFSSLAKTLSLNLTLKLDHSNYIYWKTQVFTAIEALDLECFINGENVPPPMFVTTRSGDTIEQIENPDFINWKKFDKLLMS
ncbi:hypothetical protein Dsin_012105 [Dipteronia sinensis]|uniref:Retrotransposon Copia-like N-terminal domain-containing protein n=1 Tax=Dipteronia sinensis TaxID=43782 RepID=A0AAE0AI20_9ROSI|nr:hypothetical protein Dsin_012105 [Dipteronia sinensis]